MTTPATIGARLKLARLRRGLRPEQLAPLAGVTPGVIYNIESGRSRSMRRLASVARVLAVSATWLESGLGAMEPRPLADATDEELLMADAWLLLWRGADPGSRLLIEAAFGSAAHKAARQAEDLLAQERRRRA